MIRLPAILAIILIIAILITAPLALAPRENPLQAEIDSLKKRVLVLETCIPMNREAIIFKLTEEKSGKNN